MSEEQEAPKSANEALFSTLSEDEQESLSKVLFPDTHTSSVELLKIPRDIRPLPVKAAQRLKALVAPITKQIERAMQATEKDPNVDYDADGPILEVLERTAGFLADYYNWEDVRAAVKGDGLTMTEYQALVVSQVHINGANDFSVAPLRTVVRLMQLTEMLAVRFQSLFTSR